VTGDADQSLSKLAEEMTVDGAAFAIAAGRGATGFVQEDQVEIAMIVWLPATQLS
jgi:hypothetical protein